jgi:hypothetical protein
MKLARNFTANFDATAMFNQFRVQCSVANKEDEYVVFTRIGRGTKQFTVNNVFWGILKSDSAFTVGDVVDDHRGNILFLVAKSDSYRADKAEFYRTNCEIKIARLVDEYEGTNVVGQTEEIISESTKGVYEQVSARMKLYDLGLLKSTTMRVLISKDVEVKLLDRIYLNNAVFQVDDVNISTFPEWYYLQLSIDNRG